MRPIRDVPLPGQESVWDFPRPSIAQAVTNHIRIIFGGELIADTRDAVRTIETSHPPSYYIPRENIAMQYLSPARRKTFCEWKGDATYFDLRVGETVAYDAAWSYGDPTPSFRSLKDFIAFYPGLMDECYVDDERVRPQPGRFYGGWITSKVSGPFKGEPGTETW